MPAGQSGSVFLGHTSTEVTQGLLDILQCKGWLLQLVRVNVLPCHSDGVPVCGGTRGEHSPACACSCAACGLETKRRVFGGCRVEISRQVHSRSPVCTILCACTRSLALSLSLSLSLSLTGASPPPTPTHTHTHACP